MAQRVIAGLQRRRLGSPYLKLVAPLAAQRFKGAGTAARDVRTVVLIGMR
jgi:hypothetical protein